MSFFISKICYIYIYMIMITKLDDYNFENVWVCVCVCEHYNCVMEIDDKHYYK